MEWLFPILAPLAVADMSVLGLLFVRRRVHHTMFLGVEKTRSHVLMTGSLTVMIALTLYLILAIDHPYGGTIRVEPDAFRLVLDKIQP